jgi:hypothetical protein
MSIEKAGGRVNTGQFTSQEVGASQVSKKTEGTRAEGTGNRGPHVLTDNPPPAKLATGALAPRASATRLPGAQATAPQVAARSTAAAAGLLTTYASGKLDRVRSLIGDRLRTLPASFRTGCADDATQSPLGLRE